MSVQVTEDEVDKRVREMRDRYQGENGPDPTALRNADPKYRYRGVNKNPRRVEHFKAAGYEVVPKDDKADWQVSHSEQGAKVLGQDQVLMRIPREKYIDRAAKARLVEERRMRAGIEQTRENINRMYREEVRGAKPHRDITTDTSGEK